MNFKTCKQILGSVTTKYTCCLTDKIGSRNGQDKSQKYIAPLLCPVMYKFLIFANPPKLVEFNRVSSFGFASDGRNGGMLFASEIKSYMTREMIRCITSILLLKIKCLRQYNINSMAIAFTA